MYKERRDRKAGVSYKIVGTNSRKIVEGDEELWKKDELLPVKARKKRGSRRPEIYGRSDSKFRLAISFARRC